MILSVFAQDDSPEPLHDVFHVSKAGQAGAAETRETLIALFEQITESYNAKVQADFEAEEKVYEGQRVRVIKRLEPAESESQRYLCAYEGKPSIFIIEGPELKAGDQTPPLEITPDGKGVAKVSRIVEVETETPAAGGPVTFFGVPIGNAEDDSSAGTVTTTNEERVTREETLPQFRAQPSTQLATEPVLMDKDLFLSQLRNGEIFIVERTEDRRCQDCRGFKRITGTLPSGEPTPDGKIDCPACEGTGNKTWQVTYSVVW